MAVVLALVVVAVGTRDLFFGTLPLVGQLAPLPSWSTSWHHFFSGWQSAGVGTTAPASPAFGFVGLTGTRALRRHGDAAAGAAPRLHPARRVGRLALHAPPRRRPGHALVAVICYLGPPAALRRARHGALGRPRRLRRLPLHRAAAGPGRRRRAVRGRARAAVAQPAGRPGRRARRRDRVAVGLRAGGVPARPGHGAGLGASGSLLVGRTMSRTLARAGRRGGGRRGGPGPGRALGGRDRAGRQGVGGHLRAAGLGRDGAGLGRGAPLRHRAGGPFAHRVAPGGGCGPPAGDRARHQAGLGGAPVGDGLRVVGPGLRRPRGATWAPSRPPSRSCSRRRPSPWPPASASGSPPSRTT